MRIRTVIGPVLASILFTAATLVATITPASAAAVLRVPQDFPTIQAAIDATVDGDTVLVAPGTYVELIDFLGKDIIVESAAGPAETIIDGNRAGTVVTIRSTAGQMPVLSLDPPVDLGFLGAALCENAL